MKSIILILFAVIIRQLCFSQNMIINKTDQSVITIPIEQIDSITFSSISSSMIQDADGNIYQSVQIGNQLWMAENLKTTKYNDNTSIPLVSSSSSWSVLTSPAYCLYNNDISKKNTYGAIYNWFAVNTGKLCPSGWHVPTSEEWNILYTYLGGNSVAGGKLKESGTTHWKSPNTAADNSSGFTALPGGNRNTDGHFSSITTYAFWFSSDEFSSTKCNYFGARFDMAEAHQSTDNKTSIGFSVRCIKN